MHDFASRFRRLLRRLEARHLDGFLTLHPPNLRYLFNFSGSAGLACCVDGETLLLVDSRYYEQAQSQAVNCRPLLVRKSGFGDLKRILHRYQKKRIGFEAKHVSHYFILQVQSAARWVATFDLVEDLRTIKQDTEIELIQKAFQITQTAYRRFKEKISEGRAESELAAWLEFELRRAGGEGPSFETIVASGPRSSLPHGVASSKALQKGEFVLMDFGVRYQGYTSDLTRIHLLSGAKRPRIYDVVKGAQEKVLKAIKPGVPAAELDAAARTYIREKGYGDYFGHSTGHGFGLEVHELPLISPRNRKPIRKGMVFTIEPGIYLPGRYGVRIEDAVVVAEKGCTLLSDRGI